MHNLRDGRPRRAAAAKHIDYREPPLREFGGGGGAARAADNASDASGLSEHEVMELDDDDEDDEVSTSLQIESSLRLAQALSPPKPPRPLTRGG